MKNEITKLLSKPMDRKAFLQHVGVALLAITGITGLLTAIFRTEDGPSAQGSKSKRYGR